jgi:hypothetical protein
MDPGPELLRMRIHGQPAGAGSKTPVPNGRWQGKRFIPFTDGRGVPVVSLRPASKLTEPWMELVEREAAIAWAGREPLSGPLWVDLTCFETRPQAHYRTGRYAHLLRPDAPAFPDVTTTHDSGKMRRAIEDALTNAKVWTDDKRIVDGRDRKRYADPPHKPEPCAVIRVGRMIASTATEAGLISPDPADQAALPVG